MKAVKFFVMFTLFLFCEIQSQNVNQFTGSFNYTFPLINLPSNRGSGITIDASYNAGIQMNQPASEIGLGWDINAGGAIYRNVSGFPDDKKAYSQTDPGSGIISIAQGALYPEYTSGTISYDLSRTQKGLDTAEFTMPDFDYYSLRGPAISGQLKLSYYKFYPFQNVGPDPTTGSYNMMPYTGMMTHLVYPKPQFHFTGDFADTLVSRHYPDTINSSTAFRLPTTTLTALGYTSSTEPFIGKHLSGSVISNQNFNADSGRIATSNFVEYFRNGQIDSGTVLNMIDFQTTHTRTSSIWPPEGIGYFRVTGSNGLTYHYSLPVYQLQSTTFRNPLENDYTPISSPTTLAVGDFTVGDPAYFPGTYIPSSFLIRNTETNKYAVKWLLTAITGPDFVDDGDGVADDADTGYWISYDYELWNGSYVQRFPRYGYTYQYSPDPATQEYPLYFPTSAGIHDPYRQPFLYGTAIVNKSELYHLSKIRTSSHTVGFVWDVRKDEKGDDQAVTTTSGFTPTPDIALKRVILFKNEQYDSLAALSCSGCDFDPSSHTEFDFTNTQYTGKFLTENWYTNRFVTNNNNYCILKQIVFDQDYSLCKKYQGNVEVRCDNSSVMTVPTAVQSSLTVGTYASSGKLTLNRILTYDFQNQKVMPSTIFDYDANNLLSAYSNPDYNPLKADYWGYYKSDATTNAYSRYANTYSMLYTKAWSLLKILDPLGGITEMEYESNMYNRVIDNQAPNGTRGAAFIYRIKQVNDLGNVSGSGYDVNMEEDNNSSNSVNEIATLNSSLNCIKRICMPYFENVCSNNISCITTGSFFKGFEFGNCDLTVNFTLNNVVGSFTAIPAVIKAGVSANNTPPSSRVYHSDGSAGLMSIQNSYGPGSPAYSGNGFILLETAIGYNVPGNGVRVKRINVKNSANEIYTKEYTYENGVATGEMDRFAYPRLKQYFAATATFTSPVRYTFLEPKNFERFEMSPYIGYSKVTVKNLGRVNTANGKIETTFITDPGQLPYNLSKNYLINTVATNTASASFISNIINECTNAFANVFGATKEVKVFDKNDNMMTRSVNEYTVTQQGALTEVFYLQDPYFGLSWPVAAGYYSSMTSNTVNIIHELPVVLKSSTTYGMGSSETTQSIARDELTGETTAMQSSGKNNSSSVSFKLPAYKHYFPIEGVDFTSAKSRKILALGNDMYSYGNIDSTLTSSSFLNAAYKLYSRTIRQRQYGGTAYATNTYTLPYYFNNRSFIFDLKGGLTDYGLYDKTNLYSAGLNLSTINSSLYWEPTSTYYWKLVNEATLMDEAKHIVETRDANNRFSACRYGYSNYYKTASVTNCNYNSFTFAGFETDAPNSGAAALDGDILVNNPTLVDYNTITPHTGSSCISISSTPVSFTAATEQSPGGTFETGLMSGRIYRASVWANTSNLSNAVMEIIISGQVNVAIPYTLTNTITANAASNLITTIGSWNLLQVEFELPDKFATAFAHSSGLFQISLKSTSGTVYFDDLLFHPVESDFSASIYNPRNGRMMSNLDGNGLATNYFYDASGRVTEVWKEIPSVGYKKIKKHTYNYARGANN